MDIVKLISDKVKDIAENGKLDEIVEKYAISCLDEIVRDSFSWHGEAKESMKVALQGKLQVTLESCNLDRYQKIVSYIVEEKINGTLIESLRTDIEKTVGKITGVLEKKTWKLSEIMTKYVEDIDTSYDGGMDDQYGECTLIIEKSSCDYVHIYFDSEQDKEKYRCKNAIHLDSDGQVYHSVHDGKDFSPFSSDNFDNFGGFMFKLYCNNVTIEVDEDKCETEYYREDYD